MKFSRKVFALILSVMTVISVCTITAIPAQAAVKTVNLTKNDSYKASSYITSKKAYMKGSNSSDSSHYVMFQAQYRENSNYSYSNDICENIKPGKKLSSTGTYSFSSNMQWRLYLNPTLYYKNCTASGYISDNTTYN